MAYKCKGSLILSQQTEDPCETRGFTTLSSFQGCNANGPFFMGVQKWVIVCFSMDIDFQLSQESISRH